MDDLVIRGGTILDGTGADAVRADLAVRGPNVRGSVTHDGPHERIDPFHQGSDGASSATAGASNPYGRLV